jgi:hypothetical protein
VTVLIEIVDDWIKVRDTISVYWRLSDIGLVPRVNGNRLSEFASEMNKFTRLMWTHLRTVLTEAQLDTVLAWPITSITVDYLKYRLPEVYSFNSRQIESFRELVMNIDNVNNQGGPL